MSAFIKFKHDLLKKGLEYFGLYYGTYAGIVISNDDPEKRGRLQIMCPEVWGNDKSIEKWVLPRATFAGKKSGFHAMPEKDDNIWITFRNGNADFPLWEFGWWTKDNAIEKAGQGVYVFATPAGHLWLVDENDETIYFSYKGGKSIEITKENINLGTIGGASEWAALGETLQGKLEEICDEIDSLCTASTAITVPTAMGPSGTPINAAQFVAVQGKIAAIKAVLNEILSKVVKLD